MDLRDLIDLSFLQKFQDNFALCVGVACLTEDARGNAFTRPSHFSKFCMNMTRTTDEGLRRCRQCDIKGGEEAARTGKPAVYECHTGLVDFAAPIMLEGKQIGAIYGGQVLTQPPEEAKIRCIAEEIGVDPDEYMAAVNKIPIVPEETVLAVARSLYSVANTFSRMAYQKLKLQEWNRELVLSNNRLNNIFKTMSDGVILVDKKGNIQQVNSIAEQIFAKDASQMIGKSIRDIVGSKSPCARLLERQEAYNDVEVLVDTDSGRLHCVSSGTPTVDDQGVASGGVILIRPIEKVQKLVNRFSGAHASFRFHNIVGESPEILESIRVASLAAGGKSNILLEGESGTGKELFAQAIHNQSSRNRGPFVAVNCGAIPRELIASELFGYADGAFTGAKRGGRPGKFELSSGGTLFLDEIGDMPLEQQVALLRVLQERSITRIGDSKVIPIDSRVICATNKNLEEEVKKGNFRKDLFYRLNVVSIKIPPLRQRRDDIPLLFNHMLNTIGKEWNSKIKYVESDVMRLLKQYDWPGNVRELQNVVERIISINYGESVRLEHLPDSIINFNSTKIHTYPSLITKPNDSLYEKEKRHRLKPEKESQRIITLLVEYGGNISRVAREMSISRSTLYRKMRQYNINY